MIILTSMLYLAMETIKSPGYIAQCILKYTIKLVNKGKAKTILCKDYRKPCDMEKTIILIFFKLKLPIPKIKLSKNSLYFIKHTEYNSSFSIKIYIR